ncbi:Planctomycete cytochrome C [Rosistilla carotiformis]|uniref:Planctomycete cytochrome C n=1 Tax=Rosistilla carotiformis TaxID=2528017 RepID=A0A518JYQ5_9BACT|nr:PSD1 and planctomycete cytochrome C domain-containing protein [Rosistilla carotiformis]QDV70678.1 Planctomycete cytochrome C [Rosistilla carotiformis]
MFACWVPFRCDRVAAAFLMLTLLSSGVAAGEEPSFFETQIRPILREYCFDCHGATEELEGGLDLRLVRFIKSGGDSGTALVPGDPEESLLLTRVRDGDMPPGEARVSDDKIAILEKWIASGAATLRPEPEQIGPGIPITEEERNYWAYQPIAPPQTPLPEARGTIRTPIDALLAAAMPEGLSFSPDADRFTSIQRLFNDLIGLPPTAEQVAQWMQHSDPDWYEQLVEELLRSPHYGERWARHWLDAAGYADSDGYTVADSSRDWAWRYRDYVIRSFSADKPFDRFITEQIAGDELAGPADGDWTAEQIELLTATGFLRMAADGTGSGDNSPEARNKTIADTMQIVCSTLLGSSVHCAQCHDHRYDPISHVDYFAIRSVFEPALDWKAWKAPAGRLVSLYTAADRAAAATIEEEVKLVAKERAEKQTAFIQEVFEEELLKFEEPQRSQLREAYNTAKDKRTEEQNKLLAANPAVNITAGVLYQYRPKAAEELKEFDKRIAEMRAKKPVEEFIHALVEAPNHAPVTQLFHRGDFNQPKQEVLPAGLTVVAPEGAVAQFPSNDPELPTTGRRLAFARWLTDANSNPLTPRAIVNRIWMHHFGRGIVSTPGDFGRLGGEPTHPELLDWLANDFVEHGWSLKHLHRQILKSTAWRQASYREPTRQAIDGDNHYYWRKSLQRVDAEILRDSILSVSGNLDVDRFGPPVDIAEDETGQVRVDAKRPRRSIYVRARRSQPVGMLQTFDAPVMSVNCDVRSVSTVAPQSLMMLNGDFILEQAALVAERAVAAEQTNRTAAAESATAASEADDRSWMPAIPKPIWTYGTGEVDEATGMLARFEALPNFTGTHWQGGPKVPAPGFGWVFLTKTGGHPGNPKHPAIRRWTAPTDGQLSISGSLQHGSENGDGVRGRILSAGGLRGSWNALHNSTATDVAPFAVASGETIDIVTDCLANENADSFSWQVKLDFTPTGGKPHLYDSVADFRGPSQPEDLAPLPDQIAAAWQIVLSRSPTDSEMQTALQFANRQLTQLFADPQGTPQDQTPGRQVLINICQMLINSNEFLYIE